MIFAKFDRPKYEKIDRRGKDMKFYEYGSRNDPVVVLIHGIGMDVLQSFAKVIDDLHKDYHVVAVALDGYDGEKAGFSSVREEARQIAGYLRQGHDGKAEAIIGCDLGGAVALDLTLRELIEARTLVLNGGYIRPRKGAAVYSKVYAYLYDALMYGSDRLLTGLVIRIKLGYDLKRENLCRSAKYKTIENSLRAFMQYKLPENVDGLRAGEVFYIYGTKEKSYVEGMRAMKAMCPSLRRVKTGAFSHNELMVTQPDVYARLLRRILNESKETGWKKAVTNENDGGKSDGRNDSVA